MSKEAAHMLLDAAKAGQAVPEALIVEALKATGDLAHTWGLH